MLNVARIAFHLIIQMVFCIKKCFISYLVVTFSFNLIQLTMVQKAQSSIDKIGDMLNVDFHSTNNDIWLQNANTLSRLIGILGILLPLLLWGFLFLINRHLRVLPTISHYYFTRSNVIFIIVVSLIAIFLLIYKSSKTGFIWSTLAAIGALFLLLFPTNALVTGCCDVCNSVSIAHIEDNGFRNTFHYISAAVFLCSLAIMSLFIFPKENQRRVENDSLIQVAALKTCNPSKVKTQNRVYVCCGIIMILALLVIVAGSAIKSFSAFYTANNLTFWMETLAVEAFGFSWLVRGETIFKSK